MREISRSGTTELPWEMITRVEVGKAIIDHLIRWNVVVRSSDGNDIELLYDFWDAVGGASRFAGVVRKYPDGSVPGAACRRTA